MRVSKPKSPSRLFPLVFGLFVTVAQAVTSEKPLKTEDKPNYALGQAVPVTCLNRTSDTGEHVSDPSGQLQYIPFFVCNETGRPLELSFGIEKDINCTVPAIEDPLFHLLEFYIHNDAPLTCRIPLRPLSSVSPSISPPTTSTDEYIPLIVSLSGTLQLSHLHISPHLNLVLHTSPFLLAATAYSVPLPPSTSQTDSSTRIVIGDPLPLTFSVRWYNSATLPPSTTSAGLGGHVHLSTVVYCMLSCGVGIAGSLAYFRGVELPRRIRRYGKERVGGERGGYAFPATGVGMNGYGYGGGGLGKRD